VGQGNGGVAVAQLAVLASAGGVAEEAPGACKDVTAVVEAADRAGLVRKVAKLVPLVCVKG
jgi:tRNA-splicing ligase RtcB